ncbi:MAG: 4-(cytidine 5'-diphospho)-2-C-methyl-D-erythritol kinase [Sphaerochaetaceae bacterium]|nr:4-(cytidine 5'-diphospho)-2-C-methyl-D-erythritol kinase [Sphaerochaetaceae bacterium]
MKYFLKAYAKVNIGLRVLQKREDGFHPLKSYFHKVSLYDSIKIDILESDKFEVSIKGNESYMESGEDLMAKAARFFCEQSGIPFKLNIAIDKIIPSQAGLGGGSSDAAEILLALNNHFSSPLNKEEIQALALKLGSDVPFFTSGLNAAYAEGRGEKLREVEALSYPIVILKRSDEKMSTKSAFALLDERAICTNSIGSWPLPLSEWQTNYINDFDMLQECRKEPEVMKILSLAKYNTTTGSGSAQLLVFENLQQREAWISAFKCSKLTFTPFFGVLCCNS